MAAAAMSEDDADPPPPPPPVQLPPPRRPHKQLQPRGYQLDVFAAALRGNTIAVLDTGSGKTMVAVMLAREHARRARAGEAPHRIVVFLAPTVHLVHQQFEVIREYSDLDAVECHGASGVTDWSACQWKEAIGTKEEFYDVSEWKPAVFGMTASPVATKGAYTIDDCEAQIVQLEHILDAKVYIVEDRNELESFSPSATIVNKYYDPYLFDLDDLESKLQTLFEEFDGLLVSLQESSPDKFEDTDSILEMSRKSLSRYHGKILYGLNTLGPIVTLEVLKIYNESINAVDDSEGCLFSRASLNLLVSYFKETFRLIEDILPQGYEELMKSESGSAELAKRGYISSKVDTLINVFKSFGYKYVCFLHSSSEEVLCLIFVERIMTAKAVERFMRGIVNFSRFSISYLTGGSTSKDALSPAVQRFTLDLFRAGKVNLLFTTDVTEEGIDVPNCSCVIRFDLPRTVCSYVQSRGRARRSNSSYVLMIERGNLVQQEHIFRIIRTEYHVKNFALHKPPNTPSHGLPLQEKYTYHVDSTGATITADCCVNLIYKYCEKLPKDRYYIPKPSFGMGVEDGSYQCTLTLPPSAAFRSIVGPPSRTCNLAKQLVSLEACKKLHQLGELNDHLVPLTEEPANIDTMVTDGKCLSGPGTTKRKELHGTINVHGLSGDWINESETVTLNTYRFDFVCDQEGEIYAGFVLLMESVLDDDVAHSKIDLFLIPNKMVYTTGYVRDSAFDPRRWVAPGHISLRPFPCTCGVETAFVPFSGRYIRDDPSFVVGKPCDRGHRWMCSKTVSDCVEALVGAYYVGGGIAAALWVMRWFGIDIICDIKQVQKVKSIASHRCYLSKLKDIEELEAKLQYNFSVKSLLLEAITHPSLQELRVDYCYQVLGDIMESITGAIFIDVNFNVDLVWKIVEPLLSPMITPDKLALPPYRELLELCSHLGCFMNTKCTSIGEELIIEMTVQLRDELLIAQGHDRNRKSAKAKAASRILVDLKKRGLSLKQCLSKTKQLDTVSSVPQSQLTSLESRHDYPDVNDSLSLEGLSSVRETVLRTQIPCPFICSQLYFLSKWIKVDLGLHFLGYARFCSGQRRNLNLWNRGLGMTPIIVDGVTTTNFNSFVSTITLHIPDVTVITLEGEQRTDKRSAQDSASLILLEKLQKLKVCICKMQQSGMDH
nr:unnamed protein product [Digitaria exilis]